MNTPRLLSIIALTLFIGMASADEFTELQKKDAANVKGNPFANRHSTCSAHEGNVELTEIWNFIDAGHYSRKLTSVGITQSGEYEVLGSILKITGKKGRSFDYKYKVTSNGYQYIHEFEGSKTLYTCQWMKEIILDHN